MVTKSPELFREILDGVVEEGFIAQVSRRVHIHRTMIFRWIAASEQNPDAFMVEWPADSGEIFPFHEQIKRARELGRLGHDYFPEQEATERDGVIRERMITSGMADESAPARVTDRRGRIGNANVTPPNRRSPSYYESTAKKAEKAIARRAEIDRQWKELCPESLDSYEDNSDLFSDRESDGLVTLTRDAEPKLSSSDDSYAMAEIDGERVPVTGRRVMPAVDVEQQVDLGRQRRAAAAAIPDEIVVQPSAPEDTAANDRQTATAGQPLTARQAAATQARARISARVAAGGAPMSEIERDLISSLELPPVGPRRPLALVSSTAAPVDRSGLMDDPSEGRGTGSVAPGGIKMR